MAQAPTPGVGARDEDIAAARRITVITVRGAEYRVAAANVPLRIKDRFMRETTYSVEWLSAQQRLGDVTIAALWYLGRLIAGEQVSWTEILDEWDSLGITSGDVTVDLIEPEGESPEA